MNKKLRLEDLRIESFSVEEPEPQRGTVQGHLTFPDCDTDLSICCGSWEGTCGGPTCDFMHTCATPCGGSYPTIECSAGPGGDPTCDMTCAQHYTCVYTGPAEHCC